MVNVLETKQEVTIEVLIDRVVSGLIQAIENKTTNVIQRQEVAYFVEQERSKIPPEHPTNAQFLSKPNEVGNEIYKRFHDELIKKGYRFFRSQYGTNVIAGEDMTSTSPYSVTLEQAYVPYHGNPNLAYIPLLEGKPLASDTVVIQDSKGNDKAKSNRFTKGFLDLYYALDVISGLYPDQLDKIQLAVVDLNEITPDFRADLTLNSYYIQEIIGFAIPITIDEQGLLVDNHRLIPASLEKAGKPGQAPEHEPDIIEVFDEPYTSQFKEIGLENELTQFYALGTFGSKSEDIYVSRWIDADKLIQFKPGDDKIRAEYTHMVLRAFESMDFYGAMVTKANWVGRVVNDKLYLALVLVDCKSAENEINPIIGVVQVNELDVLESIRNVPDLTSMVAGNYYTGYYLAGFFYDDFIHNLTARIQSQVVESENVSVEEVKNSFSIRQLVTYLYLFANMANDKNLDTECSSFPFHIIQSDGWPAFGVDYYIRKIGYGEDDEVYGYSKSYPAVHTIEQEPKQFFIPLNQNELLEKYCTDEYVVTNMEDNFVQYLANVRAEDDVIQVMDIKPIIGKDKLLTDDSLLSLENLTESGLIQGNFAYKSPFGKEYGIDSKRFYTMRKIYGLNSTVKYFADTIEEDKVKSYVVIIEDESGNHYLARREYSKSKYICLA